MKQVYLNQKGLTIENLKKLLSGPNDSLSALTTLTTSSNSNGKNPDADAVKWLETQGLSMTESDSLVDSALDSGKSLNLTEAGKLTLNWVKNQNVNPSSSTSGQKKIFTVNNNSVKTGTPIILVSSASAGHHQLESQKLTAVAGNSGISNSRKVQPLSQPQKIKIAKPVTIAMIPNNSLTFTRSSNQTLRLKQTVVNEKQSIDLEDEEEDGDEDSVRKQLEQERRQFKVQLAEKDREIERLKKQLADLTSKTGKK